VNRGRNFFVLSAILALAIVAALAQTPVRPLTEGVYQKWVDEDVAYIISPQERAEYLQLTSDRDRDNFIVQFWLRRDPTPGTPENEFKEEHYRRLAYSNSHFADSRAGWKTDRARIYIVNGPPDEIQPIRRAPGDELGHAGQIWRYRDGKQFRFTDECDCGEYKLVDTH